MNRRSFLAATAASAAATAVSAGPGISRSKRPSASTLARPQLARLTQDQAEPGTMRTVSPSERTSWTPSVPLNQATLTVTPFTCVEQRLARNAGFSIDLVHPRAGDARSKIYSAHGIGVGAFPAAVSNLAQPDRLGRTTLVITQSAGDTTQSTEIKIDTRQPGSYLLAIPTDPSARTPIWRASQVHLDRASTPRSLSTLLTRRCQLCALVAIGIAAPKDTHRSAEGADHAA